MSVITQFLTDSKKSGSSHPLIRTWGWLLSQRKGDAHCRIERRRHGLTYLPTKLWLELTLTSGEPKEEPSDWDTELNRWLIDQKVKAIDEANEGVRFHLILRELLQKTEIRLGDGYFSAVLIDALENTGLTAEPRISSILSKVGHYSPSHGRAYGPTVETINAALSECARLLTQLGYREDVASRILVEAIADYLDDRFSVTNRAILGLG
jgi:hypothetical protein